MSSLRTSIVSAGLIAGLIFACGTDIATTLPDGIGMDATATDTGRGPSLIDDANAGDGGGDCKPRSCADAKATCGPIGDGCGAIIQCGSCSQAGETCGGGGVPSVCGVPKCTPQTCASQGATCGAASDGCGGVIASCGMCTAPGEFCGGGGPSKCGTGTGGDGGVGDGGMMTCTPRTCTDVGATCGMQSDGCGNLINCGMCDATKGETCGGGGIPSACGKTCTPATTCPAGQNCGVSADGCGGIVSCGGACTTGTCGGGGTPNVCGSANTCVGLCTQQQVCMGGGTTSVSGKVTSPNGVLPIYGALVFVPTTPLAAFTTGVSCDQCGPAAGVPLVSTTTGPDGSFLLPNVPVSSTAAGKVQNIPVVIQLGRWRKQITVVTSACTNTAIPVVNTVNPNAGTTFVGGATRPSPDFVSTSLPRNKSEGDIPLTAISTGDVDGLECVFRKIGIDDGEFTNPSGNGRIRFYQDNGAVITPSAGICSAAPTRTCSNFGGNCNNFCSSNGNNCNTVGRSCNGGAGTCTAAGTCTQTVGTPPANTLYNDPAELAKYDMTLFECVGERQDKTATQQANVREYANKGGRVYATHFSYVWLYNNSPWSTTGAWVPGSGNWTSAVATLDTSFPKGLAFAQWLNVVGGLNAPLPTMNPPWNPPPKITINEARHDLDDPIVAPAQRWLYTTAADGPAASVQHYTFNTDMTKPAAQQCGRVLFSDFHVTTGSKTNNVVFPAECNNDPLTQQEKVLAFMLFDLASCVSPPPPPPACTPLSCAAQGIQCGQAGDGCGNVITCPNCPAGQSCGGGGVPNQCGASTCTPMACPAGTCGTVADGCGGTSPCAPCAAGLTCGGGGTPGVCGAGGGGCTGGSCPVPALGSQCGPVANGCGGLLSCQCPVNMSCINGKCATSACTPRSCMAAGANCGQVADGCGGLIDCGNCLAPTRCGGGGLANVCGGGGPN
jgi:hypothetical protein